ncbi:hypothetical protein J3S85_35935 [Streptomyces lavenduligriseus]|uniref:hypothetical protein n=1 Tax=Streptomyces eurythermus TaxID=42237 RepID=UPI00279D6756|nr:hypothetical protein J3S85_35935 [Streptomyces lavenduligriseus]
MHFCVHCGARVEDAARPDCPDCGAPLAPPEPPPGGGYVRVGATRLPVWLPWALLAVLVAGGVTLGVAVADGPDNPSADGWSATVSPGGSYGGWTSLPSPTDGGYTYTTPAVTPDYDDSGGYDDDTPTPEPSEQESDEDQDASSVVTTYYDHLNAGNFQAAWSMGGGRLYGGSYEDWVAGFSSTSRIGVTVSDNGGGEVAAEIRALQTDGTVQVFRGTYTVAGGQLVGADIRQVK